jgi:hypothetical protein
MHSAQYDLAAAHAPLKLSAPGTPGFLTDLKHGEAAIAVRDELGRIDRSDGVVQIAGDIYLVSWPVDQFADRPIKPLWITVTTHAECSASVHAVESSLNLGEGDRSDLYTSSLFVGRHLL